MSSALGDPRRAARSHRSKIQEEGRCRLCPATERLTRHHLVPQWWFSPPDPNDYVRRDRAPEHLRGFRNARHNIVPLCRRCHDLVDGSTRAPVLRLEARRRLRESLTHAEVGFVRLLRGSYWLNHHYPETTRRHDR